MAEDKEINCIDCKENFWLTGGEQDFFDRKGFQQPKRCPDCRRKKKERNQE